MYGLGTLTTWLYVERKDRHQFANDECKIGFFPTLFLAGFF